MSGRRRFGSVRRLPSGRFQARFPDPDTGKLRPAPHTFVTKTEATKWLATVEADVLRGIWHDATRGDITFGEVAAMWMDTKVHLRLSTRVIYETLLKVHILPACAHRPVGKITTLEIQQWIAERHKNSRLNANSVAKAYKVVRNVMDAAVEGGMIVRNPCRIKGAGTERLPEMRAATPEEVAAIAAAAEPRWQAFILLAAYSGPRYGELAGLRRRYVDPLHKTVRVVEQLCEVRGEVFFGPPKTQAAVRTVVLPQFIVEVMIEHLALYSQPGLDGLVFVMPEGTVMRRHNFRQRVWLPACRAAGVENLRFHDLRHTGATLAASSGAPLRAVMHRLGHASAAAALRYQHLMDGQDEAIAEFLQTLLRPDPCATRSDKPATRPDHRRSP
jgi:integrase